MLNSRQLAAKNAAAAHFRGLTTSAAVNRTTGLISENILGWGIGQEIVDGTLMDTVRVYLRESPDPTIPEHFGELRTDAIEVGQITACQNPQRRHRPAPGGVSVGHPNAESGTLGCLVEKMGNHYILSNNHVLAGSNRTKPDEPVIQPGRTDGGVSPKDDIATLEPYQKIDFTEDLKNPNFIDAAIALVRNRDQPVVVPEILGIGLPRSTTTPASIGQTVRKYGRTTKDTTGSVVEIDAVVRVNYQVGNQQCEALFDNQIAIDRVGSANFAQAGDSGSLIMDAKTLEPTALLFAVADTGRTYANPINLVLDRYGVTVVGEQGVDA